jgi:urease accessory protein
MADHNTPSVGDRDEIWIALQISDSSFPGGSFPHSMGLESALQHGFLVRDSPFSIDDVVSLTIEQVSRQLLPIVAQTHAAHHSGSKGRTTAPGDDTVPSTFKSLLEFDELCHVTLTNEVSRRSSTAQGKCFLRAGIEAFSSRSAAVAGLESAIDAYLQETQSSNRSYQYHHHYAPIFGAMCGLLGLSRQLTATTFLRCVVRDLFSAAARLNLLGPLEGARMQREYAPVAERLIHDILSSGGWYNSIEDSSRSTSRCTKSGHAEPQSPVPSPATAESADNSDNRIGADPVLVPVLVPVTTSPILEILQARHDVLYSRLFSS